MREGRKAPGVERHACLFGGFPHGRSTRRRVGVQIEALGNIPCVDSTARKDPLAAMKSELAASEQEQRLDALPSFSEQNDGGCGASLGDGGHGLRWM